MMDEVLVSNNYPIDIIIRLFCEIGYVPNKFQRSKAISRKHYKKEKRKFLLNLQQLYKKDTLYSCQRKKTLHWYTLYSSYYRGPHSLSPIPFIKLLEEIVLEDRLSTVHLFPDKIFHPIKLEDYFWVRTCNCKVYTGLKPDLKILNFEYLRYPLFFSKNQ